MTVKIKLTKKEEDWLREKNREGIAKKRAEIVDRARAKSVKKASQPLVTRPAYGEGNPALPKGDEKVAESGLPGGGPSNKGLPIDSGIPGSKTFVKPQDDTRESDKGEDESIYRTDNADDLLTDRERIDVREDNANNHDGVGAWGKGKWDGPKTKYPYRDGYPHQHNASLNFIVGCWEASLTQPVRIKGDSTVKIALDLDSIVDGLNPKFQERAKQCSVTLKRADVKNLRWILSVDCGNGPKVVKIKGFRSGTITKLSKMDLDLNCSCHAWRWLGPEHHSKREDYLDGTPRGTASVPVIKDPTGVNRVCKHVAAVLSHIRHWDVAKKKR